MEPSSKLSKILFHLCPLIALPLIMAAYVVYRIVPFNGGYFISAGTLLIVLAMGISIMLRKFKWKHVLFAIIGIGIILRIGYTLYTPCDVRSYDLGLISLDWHGHAAYILTILRLGRLPDNIINQFYQQPVFYLMASFVSKIVNGILKCNDDYYLVDAGKIVSCFASTVSLIYVYRILKSLEFDEKTSVFALSVAAFLPSLIISSGRVTPDALSTMFMILALYYTIYWYKDSSLINTIILAFIYGLGVATKISVGMFALVTLVVFILRIREEIKALNKEWFIKYIVFGFVSLPIGLFYAVSNYILFHQSLFYVPAPGKELSIYTGDSSVIERFFSLPLRTLLDSPYADLDNDVNYWIFSLQTSVFSAFSYDASDIVSYLLLTVTFLAVVLTVVGILVYAINNRFKNMAINVYLFAGIILFISSLSFSYKYPFSCSMDFRYVMYLQVVTAIFAAFLASKRKWILYIEWGTATLYMLLSTLFFISIA